MGFSLKELIPSCREKSPGTRGRGRHPGANVVPAAYHAGLPLGVGLLDPAQLRQREDGGDGVGERELVVTARGPLQLQTWGGGESTDREREQLCAPTGHGTRGPTHRTALAPGRPTSPHTLGREHRPRTTRHREQASWPAWRPARGA